MSDAPRFFYEILLPSNGTTPRDQLEDELESALAGLGEVTGGGSGVLGSNLDVDAVDERAFGLILSVLERLEVAGARVREATSTDGETWSTSRTQTV